MFLKKITRFGLILSLILLIPHIHCKKNPTTPDIKDLTFPTIWIDVFEISFTAANNGGNPFPKVLKIKNSGIGTLDYTISDDADWLTVEPAGGSSEGELIEHSVSVDKSGLEAKDDDYTATITVNCSEAANNPQRAKVSLRVEKEPTPEIWVNPASLSFSATEGGSNPPSQNIEIKNTGDGTLNYKITDDASWIEVAPLNGALDSESKTHKVTVKIWDLSEGIYNGVITISDSNAPNSPQTLNVALTITQPTTPTIWVSNTSLSFGAQEGGSNPMSQTIKVKNSGGGTLNYQVTKDASWMSVSPSSGSSGGEERTHTVSVDIGGLSTGTYNGTITVSDSSANNSPQTVGVTLSITQQPTPTIWIDTNSLSFSAQEGDTNPSSQTIKVKNSGGGTLNYQITSDASWMSVSPSSGNSGGQERTHTVSVDIGGLSTGTYNGNITISDSSATNSPQTVGVTLSITQQSAPAIWINTSSLSFNAQEGGTNPSSQNIKIKNSGAGTLNYQITTDASWMSVSPATGSSSGERHTHTVSVDIGGLGIGSYNGTIAVTDANASNNPQAVAVTLTISQQSPPAIWINTSSLSFSAQEGGSNPSSQNITVKNSGGGTLSYQVSSDSSWMSVNPTSGSSGGETKTHTVSVDISGLSGGNHNGTLTVSDSNATNNPQTISVTLQISSLPSDNKISISFSPSSGGTDTIVDISISIKGNTQDINYFGLDLTFDANMFSFQSVTSGSLTGDWAAVDGNEISSGTVKIGGFAGSGTPISVGSTGDIVVIKLKVTCSSCSDGQQSQICMSNLTDDIAGMTASLSCKTFTYNQ